MKITLSHIAILAYIVPAGLALTLAHTLGHDFSPVGYNAIVVSAVALIFGFLLSWPRAGSIKAIVATKTNRTEVILAHIFLHIGLFSVAANFLIIGAVPMLSNGAGRVALQQSQLWSLYTLGSAGIFLFSRAYLGRREPAYGKFLVGLYVFSALLTAWKSTLLLTVILYLAPRFRRRSISLWKTAAIGATLGLLMLAVNYLRGEASLADVLAQPIFYLVWGFVNFDLEATSTVSTCLHSIPAVGCHFSVDNEYLVNPTWNVFTALSPLYIDGGAVLVFVAFFGAGFILGVCGRMRVSLVGDYLYFLALYFVVFAHNGYALYSASFFVVLCFFITLRLLTVLSKPRNRRGSETIEYLRV